MSTTTSSSPSSSSSLRVPLLAVTFASSGAALNLLQQQLYYAGAGNASLLILIMPTFLGMILGGLWSTDTRTELFSTPGILHSKMKQILLVSIFDVTSLTLRSCAQNYCGSGMFTVIYASLPVFNGILSYFWLHRILNKYQWISMGIVVLGLAFSAEAEEDTLLNESDGDNGNNNNKTIQVKVEKALHQVIFGIVLGLLGTLFSSASYVCAEKVLKSPTAPKHPTTMTAVNGMNDFLLTLPWIIGYSIPHRQDLLYTPVIEKGQSPIYLFLLWCCLIVSNAAHLNSCYILLQITESVTLTMLQGVRAVMVFGISGLLFCTPKHPEQCLSTQKVLCSCIVIFGVIMYAKSTAGLSKHLGKNTTNHTSSNTTRNGTNGSNGKSSSTSSKSFLHRKHSSNLSLDNDYEEEYTTTNNNDNDNHHHHDPNI